MKNYSLKFHGFEPADLWVTENEIDKSSRQISKDLRYAIQQAKKNI
jgi:histidinol dehydrogenase